MHDMPPKAKIAVRIDEEITKRRRHSHEILKYSTRASEEFRMNETRIVALKKELESLRNEIYQGDKSIFISYSADARYQYEIAKSLAQEKNFSIEDGFDYNKEEDNNMRRALTGIKGCFCFLGIITPRQKFRLETSDQGKVYMPSIWLIEEKGMALALEKPYALLIDKSIHESIWKEVEPQKRHFLFNDKNFIDEAKEAIRWLSYKYDKEIANTAINF